MDDCRAPIETAFDIGSGENIYTPERQLLNLIIEAAAILALADRTLVDEFGAEDGAAAQNMLSTYWHAIERDTPAKTWWHAEAFHPAIARALRVDPKSEGATYALIPFRLWNDGERHVILAAHPAPRCLGPVDMDWLGIENVIAWDPRSDTATLMPADNALVGQFIDHDQGTLFASPRDFFTEWMRARAAFAVRFRQSRTGEWAHGATERDEAPGKLIIGEFERSATRELPSVLHCRGIDPKRVNKAILKSAHLPRAVGQEIREVA